MLNLNLERYGRLLLNGTEQSKLVMGDGVWERAIPTAVAKSALAQMKPTRVTGGDGVTYPAFSATTVLLSLKVHGKTEKTIVIDGKRYVVPSDVELVTDITNGSNANVDTGIYANDNMEIFARFKAITGSFYLLQARETSGAKIYGISGGQTGNTITSFGLTSGISRTAGHIYTVKVTMVNRAVTLYVKDETAGTEDTKTGTATASDYPFPSPSTVKLFGDASKLASGATVYDAYIKANSSMAWYMCGAKKNGSVGVWDPISGQFITPTGTLTAGANKPVELYGVGDKTANLFSVSLEKCTWSQTIGEKVRKVSSSNRVGCSDFIPVKPNTSYTLKMMGTQSFINGNWRFMLCDAGDICRQKISSSNIENTLKFTTGATEVKFAFFIAEDKTSTEGWDWMLIEGSEAPTSYIPYGYSVDVLIGQQGVVDLGTLSYSVGTDEDFPYFRAILQDKKVASGEAGVKMVVDGFNIATSTGSSALRPQDNTFGASGSSNTLFIRCEKYGSDVLAFKAAMSGKYLYYQRDTDATFIPPEKHNVILNKQLDGVGDYEDSLDFQSGVLTGNYGRIVFNGTETAWMTHPFASVIYVFTDPTIGDGEAMCEHFDYYPGGREGAFASEEGSFAFYPGAAIATNLTDWKAYLAEQYANGTPVTVIYPLATPTTTTVPVTPIALTEKAQYSVENTNLVRGQTSATYLGVGV